MLVQIGGFIGAALLLVSFVQTTNKTLEPNSIKNNVLNLLGAIGIGISCFYFQAYGGAVLNTCWILISIKNIISLVRTHRPH